MTVIFACGHRVDITDGTRPTCPICGDHRIATTTAPPPRFTGAALGPCATKGQTP